MPPYSASYYTAIGYMLHHADVAYAKADSKGAKYAIQVATAVAIPIFAAIDITVAVLSLGIYSCVTIDAYSERNPLCRALCLIAATPFILIAALFGENYLPIVYYHNKKNPIQAILEAKELKQQMANLRTQLDDYIGRENEQPFLNIQSICKGYRLTDEVFKTHGFSHRECLALQLVCYENSAQIFDAVLTEERPANLLAKATYYMPVEALDVILKECEGENPLGIDVNATFTLISHTKSALEVIFERRRSIHSYLPTIDRLLAAGAIPPANLEFSWPKDDPRDKYLMTDQQIWAFGGRPPSQDDCEILELFLKHKIPVKFECTKNLLMTALSSELPNLIIHASRTLGDQNPEGVLNIIWLYVKDNLYLGEQMYGTFDRELPRRREKLDKLKRVFESIESWGEGFNVRLMGQFHKSFSEILAPPDTHLAEQVQRLFRNWLVFEKYVQCSKNYDFDLKLLDRLMKHMELLFKEIHSYPYSKDKLSYLYQEVRAYRDEAAKYHEQLQKHLSATPLLPPLCALTSAYLSS